MVYRECLINSNFQVNIMIQTLNERKILHACQKLAAIDSDLEHILKTYGAPPLWEREKGFATLVHIILEQQVSLASAKACFDKLQHALGEITPENFLKLTDSELKFVGFSRQKTLYCRGIAESVASNELDLKSLENLPDEEVKLQLKKLKGIGDWTADIYLLMALGRPDIWPPGDVALLVALQRLKKLPARPTPDEFVALGTAWQPYRAVAARMLWHFYLSS